MQSLTATSASWVQGILLPQPPEWLGSRRVLKDNLVGGGESIELGVLISCVGDEIPPVFLSVPGWRPQYQTSQFIDLCGAS